MAVVMYDENALQVLNSFRPYLGRRGNLILDTLNGIIDLLSNESVQSSFPCSAMPVIKRPASYLKVKKRGRLILLPFS